MANNKVIQNAKAAFQSGAAPQPTLHLGFDDKPSDQAFYGGGSYQTHPLEEQIFDFPSPFERDTQMIFSAWTYLNPGRNNGTEIEVLPDSATHQIPIAAGDQIIVEGHLTLTHDAPVRVVAPRERNPVDSARVRRTLAR